MGFIDKFWLKPEIFLLGLNGLKPVPIEYKKLKLIQRISKPRIPHPEALSFIIQKKMPPEKLPMAITKNKCIKNIYTSN